MENKLLRALEPIKSEITEIKETVIRIEGSVKVHNNYESRLQKHDAMLNKHDKKIYGFTVGILIIVFVIKLLL